MIHLTRLNNQPMVLNSDLIELVENAPDTVITLITGNKVVVLESAEEIIDRVVTYRQRVFAAAHESLPSQVAWQEQPSSGEAEETEK